MLDATIGIERAARAILPSAPFGLSSQQVRAMRSLIDALDCLGEATCAAFTAMSLGESVDAAEEMAMKIADTALTRCFVILGPTEWSTPRIMEVA